MSPEVPQSPPSPPSLQTGIKKIHQRTSVRLIFSGVEVEWHKCPVPQRIK